MLLGQANPRQSASETVVYEMVSTYIHDLYVAIWGYEWARAAELGVPFDLSS